MRVETRKGNVVRVMALARVSTSVQAQVEHGSLEQQVHMFRRWIAERTRATGVNHELLEAHIFQEDVSGRANSAHKRTGLIAVRRSVRQGECDLVLIEKLDRLGRSQDINRDFIRECMEKNVEVHEVESGIIDLKQRGSRLSFNIKNMMAEEYSLDLEEKVTKKQREARVNNRKDTSSWPVLGLDSHPVRAGFYVKNSAEIAVVRDIFERFCELRSYKALADYCGDRGYITKARLTKEKIARGVRLAPRRLGGERFTSKSLRALLINAKIRGHGYFKDTWNQFPNLQDEDRLVRWEYEHGPLLEPELFDRIDVTIAAIEGTRQRKSESRGVYLLSGILRAADGTSFYGSRAKGGQYHYYVNAKSGTRLPADLMDDVVVRRVKQYLNDSNVLRGILQSALKHSRVGLPSLDADVAKLRGTIKHLETLIEGFSAGLRNAAVAGAANLVEVCAALIEEKKKVADEIAIEQAKLESLRVRRDRLASDLQGRSLEDYLGKAMTKFDEKSDLQKKRIVQAIVPEVIVNSEEELTLMLNPDPLDCHIQGGNEFALREEWRERRDLNPRPPA